MNESLLEWLRLREFVDTGARSIALTRAIADALPKGEELRFLDLATGRGSNVRFLAERLRGSQDWLVVDSSQVLLSALQEDMATWGAARGCAVRARPGRCSLQGADTAIQVETQQMDLGTLNQHEIFAGRHLVTGSALLDLVSESWLLTVAACCREVNATVLFTITYNGKFSCFPDESEDGMVRDLMNQHQKTDKGLGGLAAGPDAVSCAEWCFEQAGYSVRREASDWVLTPADADLQRTLIKGWAGAATEMAPGRASLIFDWCGRRLAHVDTGRSHLTVGHDDLAGWPQHG